MQSKSTMMQDLFDLYKKELLEKIDAVSIFDDPEDYSNQWAEIQSLILSIDKLIDIREDLKIESSSYFSPIIEKEPVPPVPEPEEEEEEPVYVFKRKLRGGIVLLPKGDYFLPEQMVRDMGLSDGDLVKSGPPYTHENRIRRNFTIFKKTGGENPERVQLSEFVLEKTSRGLCLTKDIYGNNHLLENGEPYVACLSHSDIADYKVKPGDIVDAAYYKNNPEGISLIFKHSAQSLKDYSNFTIIHYPSLSKDNMSTVRQRDEILRSMGFRVTNIYGTEMESTVKQIMRDAEVLLIDKESAQTTTGMTLTDYFVRFNYPIIHIPDDLKNLPSLIKQHDRFIRLSR